MTKSMSVHLLFIAFDPHVVFSSDNAGNEVWSMETSYEVAGICVSLPLVARREDDTLIVGLLVDIAAHDTARLDAWDPTPPVTGFTWCVDDNDEEQNRYFVVEAELTLHEFFARGIEWVSSVLKDELSNLYRNGVIQLFVVESEEFAELVSGVNQLSQTDPNKAREVLRRLTEIAHDQGDLWTESYLQICHAELLTSFGLATEARQLAETAWNFRGEPLHLVEYVKVYSLALHRCGHSDVAIALMNEAREVIEAPNEQAILIGNTGVVYAEIGERAKAIDYLVRALTSPTLDSDDRKTFEHNLTLIRTFESEQLQRSTPLQQSWIDAIDARINGLIAFANVDNQLEFQQRAPKIAKTLKDIRVDWTRLGAMQQVRVLLLEATLAYNLQSVEQATHKVLEATHIASAAGDEVAVAAVKSFAAGLDLTEVGDRSVRTAFEHAAMLTNRARARLNNASDRTSGAERDQALVELLEAADIVNSQRFDYTIIDDRRDWGEIIERTNSMALALACTVPRPDIVSDVLETIRSQGTPSPTNLDAKRQRTNLGTSETFNGDIESHSGYLPVRPPRIAYVRQDSPGAERGIPLGEFAERTAGEPTWWWSNQQLGDNLYWSLRSPNGTLTCGMVPAPDLRSLISDLHGPSPLDPMLHPLLEDSAQLLDATINRIAALVLPDELRQALIAHTQSDTHTCLVYAPGQGLAEIPIALLPIGDGHFLLEATRITIAPPVAFLSKADSLPQAVEGQPVEVKPVIATLGTLDNNERLTEQLIGFTGLGLHPSAVIGNTELVRCGRAGALADPDTVLKTWASNPQSIALYYGHIEPPNSNGALSTAMQLSGRRGRIERLEATRFFEQRNGAPTLLSSPVARQLQQHNKGQVNGGV